MSEIIFRGETFPLQKKTKIIDNTKIISVIANI